MTKPKTNYGRTFLVGYSAEGATASSEATTLQEAKRQIKTLAGTPIIYRVVPFVEKKTKKT